MNNNRAILLVATLLLAAAPAVAEELESGVSEFEPSNTLVIRDGEVWSGIDAQGLADVYVAAWDMEPGERLELVNPNGTTYGATTVRSDGRAIWRGVSLADAGVWTIRGNGNETTFLNDPAVGRAARIAWSQDAQGGVATVLAGATPETATTATDDGARDHHGAYLYANQDEGDESGGRGDVVARARAYDGDVYLPPSGGYYSVHAHYKCHMDGWYDSCEFSLAVSGGQSKSDDCGGVCEGTLVVKSGWTEPPDQDGFGGYITACDYYCSQSDERDGVPYGGRVDSHPDQAGSCYVGCDGDGDDADGEDQPRCRPALNKCEAHGGGSNDGAPSDRARNTPHHQQPADEPQREEHMYNPPHYG